MLTAAKVSREILKPHLQVEGKSNLSGKIRVSGAKNSALVLMTASLLTEDPIALSNIPKLTDIDGVEWFDEP